MTDKITIERETLKPCPFCGAKAEILTIPEDHPDAGAMFVQCCDSRCMTSSALLYPLMEDVRSLLVERWNRRAALAAQPADAQPTGQSPCARHCEAPAFEGEIRRLKRELQTQAERIRVLREALDVARNGLAWYIDMHPDEADDSDAETMAQIDAALEATK